MWIILYTFKKKKRIAIGTDVQKCRRRWSSQMSHSSQWICGAHKESSGGGMSPLGTSIKTNLLWLITFILEWGKIYKIKHLRDCFLLHDDNTSHRNAQGITSCLKVSMKIIKCKSYVMAFPVKQMSTWLSIYGRIWSYILDSVLHRCH